jgi:hypothetical protein
MSNDTMTAATESATAANPTSAKTASTAASTAMTGARSEPEKAAFGAPPGGTAQATGTRACAGAERGKGAKVSAKRPTARKGSTPKITSRATTKAAAANSDRKASSKGSKGSGGPAPTVGDGARKLRPGELDGLVLTFLKDNARSGPHGPTSVARGLQRSSGAVANCLDRLKAGKQVRQVGEKPRRYKIAA